MRQWVTPRSLMLHVAFILIATGCFIAAWWQLHRAMAGNTLSYLYSVEWPTFVVVAGIGWWQMFHDTPEDIAARKSHHARMRAASAAVVARTLPRSALAITVDSEEVAGQPRAIEPGGSGVGPDGVPLVGALVRPGETALRRLEVDSTLSGDPAEDDLDEMAVYNRYLALLAVKGKAKTWRNPRGV